MHKRRRPGLSGSADRKSTRLNSSHLGISYAVFCLKKKKKRGDRSSRLHRAPSPRRTAAPAPHPSAPAPHLDSRRRLPASRASPFFFFFFFKTPAPPQAPPSSPPPRPSE